MTRITTTPLAVSADYRDALVAARRAKNWMFLLLLLFLLAQITIFFLARYDIIQIGAGGEATVKAPTDINIKADADAETDDADAPTTVPGPTTGEAAPPTTTDDAATAPPATAPSLMAVAQAGGGGGGTNIDIDASADVETQPFTTTVLAWVVNSIVYLGTIFSILMAVVILLIVLIMLVGRFEGTAPSTSAFVWMALLALLLFPWQLCYGPETAPAAAAAGTTTSATAAGGSSASAYDAGMADFRVPGVLYTWGELRRDVKFPTDQLQNAVLKWSRFVGFPVVALLVLFIVQSRSGRAVKVALGEADVHVDVATDV